MTESLPAIPRPRVHGPDEMRFYVEAERYLAAVEIFRAEGCEPRWRREARANRRPRRASTTTLLLGRNERRFR